LGFGSRDDTRRRYIAYCLLGLFGVHMPLLYGEGGENAFIRLQEEIMKESSDHSLFSWRRTTPELLTELPLGRGILATHPSDFSYGAPIMSIPLNHPGDFFYWMTNKGLRIRIPILESKNGIIAILNCALRNTSPHLLGIPLKQLDPDGDPDFYARNLETNVYQVTPEEVRVAHIKTVFLLKRDLYLEPDDTDNYDWTQAFSNTALYPILRMLPLVDQSTEDSHT
jgi:hypothetical protein